MIASPPPTELVHPVYAELAAEAAAEPSVELLKEPELLEWRLPDALLKPYVDEINQAGESVIVLSPVHKQERVNAVIDRATAELLTGDNGKRIQRRLEDIAYYLARVGRRTQAGWAAAAAARLRDGIDVTKVLFFQAFIRTQLGTVAAAEQQKAEEEPRLIMTPAEAMRAREAPRKNAPPLEIASRRLSRLRLRRVGDSHTVQLHAAIVQAITFTQDNYR